MCERVAERAVEPMVDLIQERNNEFVDVLGVDARLYLD